MQKIIRSLIVLLFIFILLVFYNSLNRETNYNTDHLIGNKLANVNLKGFNDKKVQMASLMRDFKDKNELNDLNDLLDPEKNKEYEYVFVTDSEGK